jgi:CheY-like chemotaxis protein
MINKLNVIMLIDDDDSDNFFHRMIIEEMNICNEILVAEDGDGALKVLSGKGQKQPDLIFLDINMPKVDGWDFLYSYRKLNLENKSVIVMLTTSENPQDKKRALEEFSNEIGGYYNKPLTEEILHEILSRYF